MVGNRHRARGAVDAPLHDDVAAAAPDLVEAVSGENRADFPA